MLARTICALALLWIPVGGAQAALSEIEFGRYHALVIGINEYKNFAQLETAVDDATAVGELLREKYGFEVTLLRNPGRREVIVALDALRASLTDRDNLLVYYAGHGVLDDQADEGYWLPADAEESTQADWISIATITSTVKGMSAKHVMVVSDSCYSGRITRDAPASLTSGSEREDELRRLAAKRSRTALVSGGLEPVLDGGGEGHSVFTRAFLTALRETEEVMDGQQLFSAVRRPVIVNADQTPEYSDIHRAGHDGGDFLFVPVSLLQAAPEDEAEEIVDLEGEGVTRGIAVTGTAGESAEIKSQKELAFWNAIKDSGNAAMFRAYLEQFPNGTYAELAQIMIAQIEGSAATGRDGGEVDVAVVVPPDELTFEVEDTDITLVATVNANVRVRPATSAERLATIPAGAEVAVTGKVLGENWYRVARADGGQGYVYGPLLREIATQSGQAAGADQAADALWLRTEAQRAAVSRWQDDAIERRLGL